MMHVLFAALMMMIPGCSICIDDTCGFDDYDMYDQPDLDWMRAQIDEKVNDV
jgi:hypothetical protein